MKLIPAALLLRCLFLSCWQELFVQCQKLDEVKADKEYVQQEVETVRYSRK